MQFFIVITGPTGVGKTDFVQQLCQKLPFPVEVINGDVGQFYKPLSIGTAKPAYESEPVPHHLFDIMEKPEDYTVALFRERVARLMSDIWSRSAVPLIVGGSSFYIQSLYFPPRACGSGASSRRRRRCSP